MNSEELSKLIVDYQRKKSMTDAQLAFSSHLSVEKIHGLKVGEHAASSEEIEQLLKFMREN